MAVARDHFQRLYRTLQNESLVYCTFTDASCIMLAG